MQKAVTAYFTATTLCLCTPVLVQKAVTAYFTVTTFCLCTPVQVQKAVTAYFTATTFCLCTSVQVQKAVTAYFTATTLCLCTSVQVQKAVTAYFPVTIFCFWKEKVKVKVFYSLISIRLKTYHPTLHLTPWSLDLLIHVPFQLPGNIQSCSRFGALNLSYTLPYSFSQSSEAF